MDTAKLVEKLEGFFDLSDKKQRKKHHKYLEIIEKLEEKKIKLEQEVQKERDFDAESSRYQDLTRELMVISGLIDKARERDLGE